MSAEPDRLSDFLSDLSDLSLRSGIGICGNPILFITEAEDISRQYRADSNSHLHFD
jgi:hypothetical protein